MNLRLKAVELRRQLVSGTLPESNPHLAYAVGWVLNFLLGFVLAMARILGTCGPFGVAAAAQSGATLGGLICTVGAGCGYVLGLGFERGIRYAACTMLVYTAGYVAQEVKLYKKSFFMPLVASAFVFLSGTLSLIDGTAGPGAVFALAADTALAGAGTYLLREALSQTERLSEKAEKRHASAVVFLLGCVMIALSRIEIADALSVGRTMAVMTVLVCAGKGGCAVGAASGAALGAAMDLALDAPPFFTACYAFTGLTCGLMMRRSRLMLVLTASAVNAFCVAWAWDGARNVQALYEMFFASVVYMIMPNSVLSYAGAFLRPEYASAGESGLRRYMAQRLGRMSDAFQDLYDTVDRTLGEEKNDEDISKVFDSASDSVCSRCRNKSDCWSKNYMDTLSVFNDLTPIIRRRGLIAQSDLPERFTEKCQNSGELISAVNGELRGRMYRQRFLSRLNENRSAAYSQYADVAEVLRSASEELKSTGGADVLSQRRLSRYLGGLGIDADVSAFRDGGGRLHIILESTALKRLTDREGYLDELSGVVGMRLCRPAAESGEGRLTLLEAEPYSVSVGIASMKKKGETVSGDRGTYFKTDRGVLCVILSDGMGSGSEASRESVSAVRILERFLRSGVEPEPAMRMLNSMMLLKNGEEWGFATADLMCIDLFSGETGFYKYGAAPSYIKSGKTVRRVRCESLAAGLTAGESSDPDKVRMRLRPGSMAIIASDGVVAGNNDAWLRGLLADSEETDTKALAREVLTSAVKQYGCTDDMTVLAVRIENRM